ncbi:MAG: hypothetical protein NTZ13_03230 [Candidatus Parcubacteria bacterium]|nr:hypothetical protein [Candidatus Parcubacteria bacterium]
MIKFFKNAKTNQDKDFDDWKQQKNAVAKGLLRDFPWLWAIRNHHSWDDGEYTKVNQNMEDLKSVLRQSSDNSRFSVWGITSQACGVFNVRATCFNRSEGSMWAEAIMQQNELLSDILYLVIVDPLWGESHPTRRITIFRHTEKKRLNELIEHVCQLHGSNAHWLISLGE